MKELELILKEVVALYEKYNIWVYAYRSLESGYWAHNLENKAKYDSIIEAYSAGIEYVINNLNSNEYGNMAI